MSRARQNSNLAARVGRWSAAHWKTATFGWLALVLLVFAVGSQVGTKQADPNRAGPGESGRMDRVLDAGFKMPASESVLIQSRSLRVGALAFDAAVKDVVTRLEKVAAVQNVRSPLDRANAGRIAKGGHAAPVEFEIRGDSTKAADKLGPILQSVTDAQRAHPGLFVGEFGCASAAKAVDTAFANDPKSAGVLSSPLTLIILVIAFGALVAAGIPLLLALTAVFATFGLAALPSHLLPLAPEAFAVVLLVGLAVGVDYSMFYLRRERAERAAGRSERAALEAAAATSGRSVLISGLTVLVAMAGLFLTGDATFESFGVATMLVVAVAMLGSLTVLPALLSKLGDRVEKGRIPFLGRLRRSSGDSRIWSAVLTPALKHPVVSALSSAALLLVLAVPVLHLHTANSGLDTLPRNLPTVETLDRIQGAFAGSADPALVAVQANTDTADFKNAVDALRGRVAKSTTMHGPVQVDVNAAHDAARIQIPLAGNGVDAASTRALAELRNDVLPATLGRVTDATYAVGGGTAASYDANQAMKHTAPLVFGFVLLFAFALLLVAFRSIVIAVKAIVLNLLSVGAAYGVMIAVFQWGWGANLLNFRANGGIAQWLPIFMFVILFGLSMDYHVFILSRVREAYDRGLSTQDAVAHGIKTTAGTVTSAAVVMVGAFGIFATLPFLDFKEMGIGLAAAVLIDATIVRAVLLPATMKLLGEWNWYLPRWLSWLPKLEHADDTTDVPSIPAAVAA